MMLRRPTRRGTILVESALIYPVLFMLVLGIILLGIAVFRYQQVAHCAREASRWASVHGAKWAQETGNTAATTTDIYNNAIAPQAAAMDLSSGLGYSITWNTNNQQTHSVIVGSPGNSTVQTVTNYVSVTVTYTWNTGLFGTILVSSTSVTPMNY